MKTFALTVNLVLACTLAALAGEQLTPEVLLPSHEKDREDAYFPTVAFGKGTFLVAWQAGRIAGGSLVKGQGQPAGVGDIVACRVDKSGKTVDAKPFVISAAKDLQEKPRAAFGKGVFLIVWQDLRNEKDYDVYAARVSPEGKVLDPEGIRVSGGPHNQALPRVAFDGENFLVVWQDFRAGKYEVYGARVTSAGKVLDAQGALLATDKSWHRYYPAVASPGGGRSMVLWCSKGGGGGGMAGALFVKGGRVEKTVAVSGHHYARYGHGACPVSVAAGPKGYLAVWRNLVAPSRATPSRNANAGFFGPEGEWKPTDEKATKGSAFRLPGAARVIDPEAVWAGSSFVAAWVEQLGSRKRPKRCYNAVSVARLSAEGKPSGGKTAVAGSYESPAHGVTLASDGAGATLVAYEKHPKTGDVPIRIGCRLLRTK